MTFFRFIFFFFLSFFLFAEQLFKNKFDMKKNGDLTILTAKSNFTLCL